MKTIEAIVERAKDGTYSVYCTNEMFNGMGTTPDEAKADMEGQMRFYKQTCTEEGLTYPPFLDGPYEVQYKFDTESLLQYYSGIITPAALERLTGINRKQLWSYLHGRSKPRRPQVEKITEALHRLGKELSAVSL